MSGPRAGDDARFLEATIGLADASAGMSPRARLALQTAILRVWESERVARAALLTAEPRRLGRAAVELRRAREALADASLDAAADARRRRLLSAV